MISGTSSTAIGTFSQKIHSQASPSVTAPPTSGPPTTASPVTPVKSPIARPSRSRGYAAVSSAIASGITSAAPAPCTARAAISHSIPGATAHAADASVNSTRPATNSRLRPYRSPSAAPVSSSTARLRLYALTVHSSASTEAPRSCWMVLSAVVTTSASSATISDEIEVRARIQPCCPLPATCPPE
jgi:hypothetical protein